MTLTHLCLKHLLLFTSTAKDQLLYSLTDQQIHALYDYIPFVTAMLARQMFQLIQQTLATVVQRPVVVKVTIVAVTPVAAS